MIRIFLLVMLAYVVVVGSLEIYQYQVTPKNVQTLKTVAQVTGLSASFQTGGTQTGYQAGPKSKLQETVDANLEKCHLKPVEVSRESIDLMQKRLGALNTWAESLPNTEVRWAYLSSLLEYESSLRRLKSAYEFNHLPPSGIPAPPQDIGLDK